MAEAGTRVSLSCSSSTPWFFCVWEGPGGGRVCGLGSLVTGDKGDNTRPLCGEDTRLSIGGHLSSESSFRESKMGESQLQIGTKESDNFIE